MTRRLLPKCSCVAEAVFENSVLRNVAKQNASVEDAVVMQRLVADSGERAEPLFLAG